MAMELVLIVIGGILATAIIFMVVDRIRGEPFAEDDDPFDHEGYEDPVMTPELRARLTRRQAASD